VFALSGGLLAVRKGFELVGVTSLALVTGLLSRSFYLVWLK
jgi:uncharacterized membrane protein YeiH